MSNDLKISPNELKKLIESYFNSSISPQDMETLIEIASCSSDKYNADTSVAADLRAIRAIRSASLQVSERSIPPGLEERSDALISRLARRSSLRRRIIAFSASAAALATIISVGSFLWNGSLQTETSLSSSSSVIAEVSTPIVKAEGEVEIQAEINPSLQAKAVPPLRLATPHPPVRNTAKALPDTPPASESHDEDDSQGYATRYLPPMIELLSPKDLLADASPVLAQAVVNPADILTQPISTLSQSVDYVYVTVEAISEILHDINNTVLNATALAFSPEILAIPN